MSGDKHHIKIIFTLCSNNYLAQASVLAESIRHYQPDWKFYVGLVDKRDEQITYETLGFDVIEASSVEPGLQPLAEKYSIVELNTCVKPSFFLYFFEECSAEVAIYMDPDTCLYAPMHEIEKCLEQAEIVLTPHILSPIPLDRYTPQENLFLNYGIYNLGFLALKRTGQTINFLNWWKERTYLKGYDKPAEGLFTDQLWINLAPIYFNHVEIIRHPGYNMAPWNLHERSLTKEGSALMVCPGVPLVFFHFSGFDPAKRLLHKEYSRFKLDDRPDLSSLYDNYRAGVEKANFAFYSRFPCFYSKVRRDFLDLQQALLEKEELSRVANFPLQKRLLTRLKRYFPASFRKLVFNMIKT